MTNEELINNLKYTKEKHKNDKVFTGDTNISLLCEDVLKALEQQPCEAILDKIRAEIESQREKVSKKHSEDEGLTNYYFGLNDGLKDARDIIDKYKAESEEEE